MIFIVTYIMFGLCSVLVNVACNYINNIPTSFHSIIIYFFGLQIFWFLFIFPVLAACCDGCSDNISEETKD